MPHEVASRTTSFFHHVPWRPDKHHPSDVCTNGFAGWLGYVLWEGGLFISGLCWLRELPRCLLWRYQPWLPSALII